MTKQFSKQSKVTVRLLTGTPAFTNFFCMQSYLCHVRSAIQMQLQFKDNALHKSVYFYYRN